MTTIIQNKKIATMALAGILAMGAFSAAPAFAGHHGANSCSAAGCSAKTEKNSCKAKASCKDKTSCKSMSSCKDKSSCKEKCNSGCKSKGSARPSHSDNDRYND